MDKNLIPVPIWPFLLLSEVHGLLPMIKTWYLLLEPLHEVSSLSFCFILELDDLMEPEIIFDPQLNNSKPWHCKQCGKNFKKKCHVKDHIEGSHMIGVSYSCPYCGMEIASRHRMRTHISNKHNTEHKEKQIKISQIPNNYSSIQS